MSEPRSARESPSSLAADRASPPAQGQPGARPWPVTEEAVQLVLAADIEWARGGREAAWQMLSTERARFLLEAAAPLITAPRLSDAECDRLHQMVTGYGDALAAIGRALESAAQPGGADCGVIAAAWEALEVLKGSSEEEAP